MPESVEQAIMQRCGALCLSVTSGAEAVDMLKTSKRIWVDLKEALDTPSDDFAIKLVVREWLGACLAPNQWLRSSLFLLHQIPPNTNYSANNFSVWVRVYVCVRA
jgi:hypothetical protein